MRRFTPLLGGFVALLLGACSVGYYSDAEDAYREAWLRGADRMDAAEPAMAACDLDTGEASECVEADAAMRTAIRHFLGDLERQDVPSSYQAGDEAWRAALREIDAALERRDEAINDEDNDGLSQALDQMAAVPLEEAVALYPDSAGFSVDLSD